MSKKPIKEDPLSKSMRDEIEKSDSVKRFNEETRKKKESINSDVSELHKKIRFPRRCN